MRAVQRLAEVRQARAVRRGRRRRLRRQRPLRPRRHRSRTGRKSLLRGLDHRKDQSYVLFGITPEALDHTLLPIGGFEKHEVRAIAEELKLPVFNKPDSQEICFVPNQDYAGLVERRTPGAFRAGEFVDAAGEVVGTHDGHQHFTIGQRKGLGVALGYPIYVVDIDPASNRVTVGEQGRAAASGRWSPARSTCSTRRSARARRARRVHREDPLQPRPAARDVRRSRATTS